MKTIEVPCMLVLEDETTTTRAKLVLERINYWYEVDGKCCVVMDNCDTVELDTDMDTFGILIENEEKALK